MKHNQEVELVERLTPEQLADKLVDECWDELEAHPTWLPTLPLWWRGLSHTMQADVLTRLEWRTWLQPDHDADDVTYVKNVERLIAKAGYTFRQDLANAIDGDHTLARVLRRRAEDCLRKLPKENRGLWLVDILLTLRGLEEFSEMKLGIDE